ncbi:MAG: DUF6265 family protein [Rhodospirillaceae bacterium]|nr:DUF6265 family protein [Rhodospirillaceae bacterium]
MRKIFTTAALISMSLSTTVAAQDASSVRSLMFLAGCWASPREASEQLRECFTAPYAGLIQSSSHTVKDKKTASWEFAVISENGGKVTYAPFFMGKALSTFTLTRVEGQTAVFENPTNDLPKKLIYRRNADRTLTARTEGAAADDPQNQEWIMAPQDGQ